ncbi:MAG: ABC transporter permease [bacterium]|nr:ABC transporter permease [bacterium]
MSFTETFRIAINALLTNRLRSALTTLGIVIGVGAVIGLVSLGRGVEEFVAKQFNAIGSNSLIIASQRPSSPTRTRIDPLTMKEANDLKNPLIAPNIRDVAPQYAFFALVAGDTGSKNITANGVVPQMTTVRNWNLASGDFISQADLDDNTRVAVLGADMVELLFGDDAIDPIGASIRINERVFTVIGVMESVEGFGGQNDTVLIPITTAQTRMVENARARDGSYKVSSIYIQVVAEEATDLAKAEIATYMDEAHGILFDGEQDYRINDQSELRDFVLNLTVLLTLFLSMIAGISLLVGGIGIMNIMLVSVTERTREIGLRKAVGARGGDILLQFLIESLMLSLIGGALGIGVGWLASLLGTALIDDITLSLSADAVLLATIVSTGVGLFFGAYPASRAARMKPIDALRFE